jgi:hypothetical protein
MALKCDKLHANVRPGLLQNRKWLHQHFLTSMEKGYSKWLPCDLGRGLEFWYPRNKTDDDLSGYETT